MKLTRRQSLHLAVGAIALPAVSRVARAQTYPTRLITMIVSGAAGGNPDTVGRVVAERMSGQLGRSIIIENVSGADGRLGTDRAARARPDGYTIDLGYQGNHVLNGASAIFWSSWLGLFAPKGTPKDIIGKLNVAAVEALGDSAVRSRLADLGQQIFPREQQTPEVLGALVKADAAKYWPMIKEFGIKGQ